MTGGVQRVRQRKRQSWTDHGLCSPAAPLLPLLLAGSWIAGAAPVVSLPESQACGKVGCREEKPLKVDHPVSAPQWWTPIWEKQARRVEEGLRSSVIGSPCFALCSLTPCSCVAKVQIVPADLCLSLCSHVPTGLRPNFHQFLQGHVSCLTVQNSSWFLSSLEGLVMLYVLEDLILGWTVKRVARFGLYPWVEVSIVPGITQNAPMCRI